VIVGYRTPLEQRMAKKTTRAITEYNLIEDGDRIMVGLSGGKDSWALIQILDVLRYSHLGCNPRLMVLQVVSEVDVRWQHSKRIPISRAKSAFGLSSWFGLPDVIGK
jgi:hypothetical protein